jgi:hypothetical protein
MFHQMAIMCRGSVMLEDHAHPFSQRNLLQYINFKQLYLHTAWKLDTCLYEIIYSEYSILPPPKIFAIPPETPCISRMYMWMYVTYVNIITHPSMAKVANMWILTYTLLNKLSLVDLEHGSLFACYCLSCAITSSTAIPPPSHNHFPLHN